MNEAAFAAQPWDAAFQPGMSLRDWFAGQALANMHGNTRDPQAVAAACYRYADALVAYRNTKTPKRRTTKKPC